MTKSKTVFPTNNRLLKMLYLTITDTTVSRQDWSQIHSQLEIYFEERLSAKNL